MRDIKELYIKRNGGDMYSLRADSESTDSLTERQLRTIVMDYRKQGHKVTKITCEDISITLDNFIRQTLPRSYA